MTTEVLEQFRQTAIESRENLHAYQDFINQKIEAAKKAIYDQDGDGLQCLKEATERREADYQSAKDAYEIERAQRQIPFPEYTIMVDWRKTGEGRWIKTGKVCRLEIYRNGDMYPSRSQVVPKPGWIILREYNSISGLVGKKFVQWEPYMAQNYLPLGVNAQ